MRLRAIFLYILFYMVYNYFLSLFLLKMSYISELKKNTYMLYIRKNEHLIFHGDHVVLVGMSSSRFIPRAALRISYILTPRLEWYKVNVASRFAAADARYIHRHMRFA